MSEVTWEGINAECIETHIAIYQMFCNLTPENVVATRKAIYPHLMKCKSCRELLNRMYEEKAREIKKK